MLNLHVTPAIQLWGTRARTSCCCRAGPGTQAWGSPPAAASARPGCWGWGPARWQRLGADERPPAPCSCGTGHGKNICIEVALWEHGSQRRRDQPPRSTVQLPPLPEGPPEVPQVLRGDAAPDRHTGAGQGNERHQAPVQPSLLVQQVPVPLSLICSRRHKRGVSAEPCLPCLLQCVLSASCRRPS